MERLIVRKSIVPLVLGLLSVAQPARSQNSENVLVVVNNSSADSSQIADYYVRKRAIPTENVVHLSAPTTEQITRTVYEQTIEAPISTWFGKTGAFDRILYIVLTKGVPLRIAGSDGLDGTVASVDSELTLLYRSFTGVRVSPTGRVLNPYFAAGAEPRTYKPFTHDAHDIYLVTRLDGYTVQDVIGLIDRGAAPAREGQIVLDEKATLVDRGGDAWLDLAATRLAAAGFKDRVVLDTTANVVTDLPNVLGYYGWGSNDPANRRRHLGLSFVPGALGGMFVSSDGRTFAEPPEDWKVGAADPRGFFAGTPQSLAGDLIRDGITGLSAHVAEPYLAATVRPDILFPAYILGANLAEAFYLGMPFLSWQTVILGDPLCAPFRKTILTQTEIDPGIDPATEMPELFGARRKRMLAAQTVKAEAVPWLAKAESRLGKGVSAREALEEAVRIDGGLQRARAMLGLLYDQEGDHAKAIDQYRAVIATAPNDVLILNNLAYSLAVHLNQPGDALPFAQRAFRADNKSPDVTDTLAWVQHLLGNDAEAVRLLSALIARGPVRGEIRLHAAVVFDSVGRPQDAARELELAVRASPDLAKDDMVIQLRERLQKGR